MNGAKPVFVPATVETGFMPDYTTVARADLEAAAMAYLCTPANPQGTVASLAQLKAAITLARKHDFVLVSDECYSELYNDESAPPPGLLQAAAELGNTDYRRCLVFHSLSKRSSLPGLRSGFVAGDAALIDAFFRYRTYHGCSMPLPTQAASAAAWNDEVHVVENRALYRAKFDAVLDILGNALDVTKPDAGFYLWAGTPTDDTHFARELFRAENVTVLPGQFLARESSGHNPGERRVRMALVATLDECVEAATRIRRFVDSLK